MRSSMTKDRKPDEYIVLGNKPYILLTTNTNLPAFIHNGQLVVYDKDRDGPTLDAQQVREQYPEWAI